MDKISEAALKKFPVQMHGTPDFKERFDSNEFERETWKAGATFYRDEVMRGEMEGFAKWLRDNYRSTWQQPDSWRKLVTREIHTSAELPDKYFEHLKQQQYATTGNKK
jgi:hypothetical protein